MSKSFSCDYITIRRNGDRWDAREEKNKEKDDRFWLLWGIFNEYIKQIFMAELRKANFDICKLTFANLLKINHVKRDKEKNWFKL